MSLQSPVATGAWWGLRPSATGEGPGFPVAVFGGDHADVPLEPLAGRMLARALVKHGFSAMFDVGLMLTDHQIRFAPDFASELLRINRTEDSRWSRNTQSETLDKRSGAVRGFRNTFRDGF